MDREGKSQGGADCDAGEAERTPLNPGAGWKLVWRGERQMDSLGSLCSLDGGKGPRKSTGRKLNQSSRWIIGWSDRAERRQGLRCEQRRRGGCTDTKRRQGGGCLIRSQTSLARSVTSQIGHVRCPATQAGQDSREKQLEPLAPGGSWMLLGTERKLSRTSCLFLLWPFAEPHQWPRH